MAAKTLQGRDTEYQAKFGGEGGGNIDFITALTRPFFSPPLLFLVRPFNQVEKLPILITSARDKYRINTDRSRWEIRGLLLSERFSRKEKGQAVYAEVELDYSTYTRRGELRVLSHDQPPPIVEVVEWCQMVARANKTVGQVLEVRRESSASTQRGIIELAEFYNDRFMIQCLGFFESRNSEWVKLDERKNQLQCMIPHRDPDAPKPLIFRDGRIMFESAFGDCRTYGTIYPRTTITW